MWLCLSAFWIVFNLILYFEIHLAFRCVSLVKSWTGAFFTGIKLFSLPNVRIRGGRYFSLGISIFSLKNAGLDQAKSFTSHTLAKKSPQKITSEFTWHKPFHSGSLFWSANLDCILINVFLLSCINVQMWFQHVSYVGEKGCSPTSMFSCVLPCILVHSTMYLSLASWLSWKNKYFSKKSVSALKEQLVTAALCWAARLKLSFGKMSFPWKISINFP